MVLGIFVYWIVVPALLGIAAYAAERLPAL